jgi:hypothetical protein
VSTGAAAVLGFAAGFLVVMFGGTLGWSNETCDDLCGLNLVVVFPFAVLAGLICALVAGVLASRARRW